MSIGFSDLEKAIEITWIKDPKVKEQVKSLLKERASGFAEALGDKDLRKVPKIYHKFLLMDILHYKKEEIEDMNAVEMIDAINYSWMTFMSRNMLTGKKDKKGKNDLSLHFKHTGIEAFIKESYGDVDKFVKTHQSKVPPFKKRGKRK